MVSIFGHPRVTRVSGTARSCARPILIWGYNRNNHERFQFFRVADRMLCHNIRVTYAALMADCRPLLSYEFRTTVLKFLPQSFLRERVRGAQVNENSSDLSGAPHVELR